MYPTFLVVAVGHGKGLCSEAFTDYCHTSNEPKPGEGSERQAWLELAARGTGTARAAIDEILIFRVEGGWSKWAHLIRVSDEQF